MSKAGRRRWISILVIALLIPAALIIAWYTGDRRYYLVSTAVMVLALLPFFVSFEKRRPSAGEMVILAVMCALAVAARAAFVMVPHLSPILGMIMISGMCLGAEAGFMTGAISAFVSNFVFGQGPWTPWQMFIYGLAGFIAGTLCKKGILKPERRIPVAVFGGTLVLCFIGPLLDTSTFFLVSMQMNGASAMAVYSAGLPVNAINGMATAVTLLILCKPVKEKLDRINVKYGFQLFDTTGQRW